MGSSIPREDAQAAPGVWTLDFGPSQLRSAKDIRFGFRSSKAFGQKQFDLVRQACYI